MEELLQKQKEMIIKLQKKIRKLEMNQLQFFCKRCNKVHSVYNKAKNGYCKECERQRAKDNYKRRLKSEQV